MGYSEEMKKVSDTFKAETKRMGVSVEAYAKANHMNPRPEALCKCDKGSYKAMTLRLLSNRLGCERSVEAIKAGAQEWYKEHKKAEAKKRRIEAERAEILKGDDYMSGLRTGKNGMRAEAFYSNVNYIKVDYETDSYCRSCSFTMYKYFAKVNIKRGYSMHLIGGLYTIIKGDRIKREGMKATWCIQGRSFTETCMVDGYLVRGEHIAAKSLEEAKRINKANRAKALVSLMRERRRNALRDMELSKIDVTISDSINGGNCQFGTDNFRQKVEDLLGHEVTHMSADELMRYARLFKVEYYALRAVNQARSRIINEEVSRVG